MKKVYLFLAFLWLGSMAVNAQFIRPIKIHKSLPTQSLPTPSLRKAGPSGNHQIRSIFWMDDFSVPANWTISHSTGGSDWVIGTNSPSGPNPIDPITSNTAANNFALFDSDALCDTAQIADLTTATPINCTGHPNVRLMFTQYYRRYVDSTFVLVSNNGSTWTKYSVNEILEPFQFNENHRSHTASRVTLDVSSVAGNQDSVWVRFEFYSPSLLGPGSGCGYAWMVDDVSLLDIDSTDARIAPAFAGEYSQMPIIQAEGFKLRGKIINNGLTPITGAKILFDIIDSQTNFIHFDSSVASGTINPGDTSGYLDAANGDYPITLQDVYRVQQSILLAGDTTTFNDFDLAFVDVNDSTYSRDYASIDGDLANAFGFPFPNFPSGGYFGQTYHIYQSSAVTSATFLLTQTVIGAQIRVQLYSMASGVPQALLGSSATHTIGSADTTFGFMTLPFTSPISVTPGDYLLAINQMDTNFIGLTATDDIVSPGALFFRATSPNWSPLPLNYAMVLRMNNPTSTLVGINETEKNPLVYVYPNPTNGIIHIVGADEKNVQINILNPLGQIIKTEYHETLHSSQIDLSGFAAGVYTVNIHTATTDINKSVVLK